MPLTRELTNLVIEGLRDLIDETRFETIPFLREDFEKGLSYLAEPQPWLSESERLQNRSLFLDISDAIHQVLVNAQNELLRKHPVCPSWLLCLVHRMYAERAFVITLNYDTLLEMAASEFCFGRENTFISDFLRPFKFPATEGQVYAESPKSFQLLNFTDHSIGPTRGLKSILGKASRTKRSRAGLLPRATSVRLRSKMDESRSLFLQLSTRANSSTTKKYDRCGRKRQWRCPKPEESFVWVTACRKEIYLCDFSFMTVGHGFLVESHSG